MMHVLGVSRVVADLSRASGFYRDALGFRMVRRGRLRGLRGAFAEMRLGGQAVSLVRFARRGRPYPPDGRSNDLWFQHLAIVVGDMDAAYAHLQRHRGWRPISDGPPALLPPSDGSVRAWKFRDPDGHPLELIWFPPGQGRPVWQHQTSRGVFLGIDHSAISVSSGPRSLRFYRRLGFHATGHTLNRGPAQAALDGLADPVVVVTALRPPGRTGLGLELLAYRPPGRHARIGAPNDRVTDWLTLGGAARGSARAVRDPDGHLLLLTRQGGAAIGSPAWAPAT